MHHSTNLVQPILGLRQRDGEPVNCIQAGDVEGNSPSYLTIDGQGRSEWMSFDDVRIIDTRFLPPSRDQLTNAAKQLTSERVGAGR